MRSARMQALDPYGEDADIQLPAGCIVEDVDIDFGVAGPSEGAMAQADGALHRQQQQPQPRPLTFGLENGPLATLAPNAQGQTAAAEPNPSPQYENSQTTANKPMSRLKRLQAALSWLPCISQPDLEEKYGRKFTFGERLADRVSNAVGSWAFVITQSLCLFTWLMINIFADGPDPYPFILLNLLLSFQAAYTGPVVMMSQNRQSDIDRDKAFDLHEKVDHIRLNQVWALWDLLMLQQKKIDAMHDSIDKVVDRLDSAAAEPSSPQSAPGSNGPASSQQQQQEGPAIAPVTSEEESPSLNASPSRPASILRRRHSSGRASPAFAQDDGPCACLPPHMCDTCMHALERAQVGPAALRKANPRYLPTMPSSFPTAEFVPHADGHHAVPLDYLPAFLSPPLRTRDVARANGTASAHLKSRTLAAPTNAHQGHPRTLSPERSGASNGNPSNVNPSKSPAVIHISVGAATSPPVGAGVGAGVTTAASASERVGEPSASSASSIVPGALSSRAIPSSRSNSGIERHVTNTEAGSSLELQPSIQEHVHLYDPASPQS